MPCRSRATSATAWSRSEGNRDAGPARQRWNAIGCHLAGRPSVRATSDGAAAEADLGESIETRRTLTFVPGALVELVFATRCVEGLFSDRHYGAVHWIATLEMAS